MNNNIYLILIFTGCIILASLKIFSDAELKEVSFLTKLTFVSSLSAVWTVTLWLILGLAKLEFLP